MAFHHRKLLNESLSDQSLAQFCDPFCDNKTPNPDPICPLKCMDLCPYSCNPALLLLPPPPLSPETPIPVLTTAPENPNTLSIFLTISLAILATAFLLFTCYTVYRFFSGWLRRRRRRSDPPENEGADFVDEDLVDHPIWYIRTVGLQPAVIGAITVVRFKKGDGLIDGSDCSVCLNEFLEGESLRLLPKCKHAFHIACIDTWLTSHTNCPLCRAGIVSNAGPVPLQEELVVRDSGPVEEARLGNVEVLREESGLEIEQSDLGIRVEDEGELRAEIGLKQPVRRSVSLDSLSASVISSAIATQSDVNLDNQLVEVKGSQSGVVSIERSIQTGSCSIKRSLSCSAKVSKLSSQEL